VFQNRLLRRIYQVKEDEMGRACRTNGEKRSAYRILAWKPEGKEVGRWIIFKWILRELGWGGRDWIDLVQDGDQWRALVNTVMNLRVP
jgi:hypothetical protein